MKLTAIVQRQHLGRMIKRHWLVQGQRLPIDHKVEDVLAANNIPVFSAVELLNPKPTPIKLPKPETPVPKNWNEQPRLVYGDTNVLVAGLKQALVLTKSVCVEDKLPEVLNVESNSNEINHDFIKQLIMSSVLFDAEQKKLPKLKDPSRPAWVFPRVYGITHKRRMELLTTRLMQYFDMNHTDEKFFVTKNAKIVHTFEKDGQSLQFNVNIDSLISSNQKFSFCFDHALENDLNVPDLYPIAFNISIPETNIYEANDLYPIQHECNVPHMIFIHHDPTTVANLTEMEVTEDQIHARGLLKTFATSAAFARVKYGTAVKDLPEPITVKCINTDGQFFHFGLFQLNTLDLDGDRKNIWCQLPTMHLYTACEYNGGVPVLTDYNENIGVILGKFWQGA